MRFVIHTGSMRKRRNWILKIKKNHLLFQLDVILLLTLVAFAFISIVAISSATYTSHANFDQKQQIWYIVGFLCLFLVLLFDYKILKEGRFLEFLYGLGIFLCLLVFIPGLGVKVNGAQLWLGVGDFRFQPSEWMKVVLILLLAKQLSVKKDPVLQMKDLWKSIGCFILPFIIIMLQPDMGTALILIAILASMLFVRGLPVKWFIAGFVMIAVILGSILFLYWTSSPLLTVILKDHQIERIQTFLDPASDPTGAGYQATQAKIAIGSGMLKGKGYQQGTQAQGEWIPEPHNDFIFAVIAEEFGFIGASLLLLIYLVLFYRMLVIATRSADSFGMMIIAGMMGMLVFQVFQNIGMTIGLLPITGIPLPFISYGGSSLISQLAAMGIVLNIGMRSTIDLTFGK